MLLFSLPARFYLGVVAWLVGSKVASTYGAGPLYMVSCGEDWGGVKEVVGVAAQGSQYAANRGRCRLGMTQDGWPAVMCRGLSGGGPRGPQSAGAAVCPWGVAWPRAGASPPGLKAKHARLLARVLGHPP